MFFYTGKTDQRRNDSVQNEKQQTRRSRVHPTGQSTRVRHPPRPSTGRRGQTRNDQRQRRSGGTEPTARIGRNHDATRQRQRAEPVQVRDVQRGVLRQGAAAGACADTHLMLVEESYRLKNLGLKISRSAEEFENGPKQVL